MSQQHRPAGSPASTGGQFTEGRHDEADVALAGAPAVSEHLAELRKNPEATAAYDALIRARDVTAAADELQAAAVYRYIVAQAAAQWPGAAAIRVALDDDQDWYTTAVVDAAGNELAAWPEAGNKLGIAVSEIQECGHAWRVIDDSGEDPLHDGPSDATAGVLRLDQTPFPPAAAPPEPSPVRPSALQTGDVLVGDSGGHAAIVGEVGPSSAWPGFISAEVEHGMLLLDDDVEIMAIQVR
jgi:hypothetical protein